MLNQKHAFWEALIITLFIFGLGILIGIFIENSRAARISEIYLKSEINLLDIQIQSDLINSKVDCDQAIKKNIEFGDRIYEDAKKLQRYEDANKITDSLKEQHKRYDLLRLLFWLNSIKLKERCGDSFHTVVYLYDYSLKNREERAKQKVFSRFLHELKKEKGDDVMLIPIAKNLNLTSIELVLAEYNISDVSVIVDEKLVVNRVEDLYKVKEWVK